MKKAFKNIACMGGLLTLLISVGCGEKDKGSPPAGLSGLEAVEGLPGRIDIKWNMPSEDDNIYQIKVSYYDHRLKKDVLRVASAYSSAIEIPDTRQRYGQYTVTLQAFSADGVGGAPQTVTAVSGPALGYYITGSVSDTVELPLTVASLYTNAQEPSEGPIANLLDNDKSTFFHSTWSSGKWSANTALFLGDKHYLQVDLGVALNAADYFSFYYAPRNNASNHRAPTDFDLYGSLDGDSVAASKWVLIKNFTKDDDNLPTDQATEYRSPILQVDEPIQYIRLSVNHTLSSGGTADGTANSGIYFTMSELKIYTYKGEQKWYNPETDEEEL
jgi:hypothetical protein